MGLPAGRLRHRVSIEALVIGEDSDGATEEEWVDQFGRLLPAEIVALSGRELIAANAVRSKVATRIRMRWRAGIEASMRVVHRSTAYNIEAVLPDPDSGRTWLTLLCTSGVVVELPPLEADPGGAAALNFSSSGGSQYLALVSVGGM